MSKRPDPAEARRAREAAQAAPDLRPDKLAAGYRRVVEGVDPEAVARAMLGVPPKRREN